MSTREKLDLSLKEAMRAGDDMRRQTVRMVMSAVKLNEVEKGAPLDDAAVIAIVQKEIKSRNEAISEAQKANRPDLVDKSAAEVHFLETFLPQQLSQEEVEALVREAVAEVGAKTPADMGKVMKVLMPKISGRAPGDQISQLVKKQLSA